MDILGRFHDLCQDHCWFWSKRKLRSISMLTFKSGSNSSSGWSGFVRAIEGSKWKYSGVSVYSP